MLAHPNVPVAVIRLHNLLPDSFHDNSVQHRRTVGRHLQSGDADGPSELPDFGGYDAGLLDDHWRRLRQFPAVDPSTAPLNERAAGRSPAGVPAAAVHPHWDDCGSHHRQVPERPHPRYFGGGRLPLLLLEVF